MELEFQGSTSIGSLWMLLNSVELRFSTSINGRKFLVDRTDNVTSIVTFSRAGIAQSV
jgi:hypothetical protein